MVWWTFKWSRDWRWQVEIVGWPSVWIVWDLCFEQSDHDDEDAILLIMHWNYGTTLMNKTARNIFFFFNNILAIYISH